MMLKIHKIFIRPILEYAFQVWNPYFIKNIEALEKVQRSFTKVPRLLKQQSYEERLIVLKLTTLKSPRDRGDLIETFNILNGHYDIEKFDKLFIRIEKHQILHCQQKGLAWFPGMTKAQRFSLKIPSFFDSFYIS
ncbi:unnamed protein product, partial [Parnassius mnemosyne]